MHQCEPDQNPLASTPRRELIKGAAALGALAAFNGLAEADAKTDEKPPTDRLPQGAVILFQGDSITDAGRKRDIGAANNSGALGRGYSALIAGELLAEYPEHELQIYNRGISGNKVPDLAERWQSDATDLKPTILSVLIGINDLWHTVAFGKKYKGTVADYKSGLKELLERSQKEIPNVRLVLCEPFTLRDWPAFDPYRAAANEIAAEMKLTHVPFQTAFDDAAKAAPTKFWLWDGIHPSTPGYALMARTWRKAVGI